MIAKGDIHLIGVLFEGYRPHELILIQTDWAKVRAATDRREIRFGMRRNISTWPGDEYCIAVLEEDGRYHIDQVAFQEDKNGVLSFDVRAYLKRQGLPWKCAHLDKGNFKWRKWSDMYPHGRGIVAETGFCLSRSLWVDMWAYSLDIYYAADGMMTYEGQDIGHLELRWIEKDYYDVPEIREMIRRSFEAPHTLSREQVREILTKYGDGSDLSYFSAKPR